MRKLITLIAFLVVIISLNACSSAEPISEEAELKSPDGTLTYEEPFGTEIPIDAETQKKMNDFLSSFSEALMFKYDKDNRDLQMIFRWVYLWSKINKSEYLQGEKRESNDPYNEYYSKIGLGNINKVTGKYLGFEVTEEEASQFQPVNDRSDRRFFEHGYYYESAADGDEYTLMSIVEKVEDIGDGRLKLYYAIYSRGEEGIFDPAIDYDSYYALSEKEASMDPLLKKKESGYAVVKVEGDSYILEHLISQSVVLIREALIQ